MVGIFEFLESRGIPFTRYDHPAVFTCEEARAHLNGVPGTAIKNLFLRDRDGKKHFLAVVPEEKRVDLKALASKLNADRLSFASAERLKKYLGVEPGSVTILGLINDLGKDVQVVIDQDLRGKESLQCHPLVNTATLVIKLEDIERFLGFTGQKWNYLAL